MMFDSAYLDINDKARTDYKKDQDSERLNFRETYYNFYGTKKMAEMGVFICIYEKL